MARGTAPHLLGTQYARAGFEKSERGGEIRTPASEAGLQDTRGAERVADYSGMPCGLEL